MRGAVMTHHLASQVHLQLRILWPTKAFCTASGRRARKVIAARRATSTTTAATTITATAASACQCPTVVGLPAEKQSLRLLPPPPPSRQAAPTAAPQTRESECSAFLQAPRPRKRRHLRQKTGGQVRSKRRHLCHPGW